MVAKKVALTVNKNRPVNLDISTFSLPITAYVSILHRVSGVILFGVVALLLWALGTSLSSESGFESVKEVFSSPIVKLIMWASLAALAYHLVAGVRHLFMDAGIGETLEGGKAGAKVVIAVAIVLILLAGVWVW
ncbi:succinate dehydrogenase, cytochrome b556 subunit [Sessilibacter corallicola]|uniref:Succinate dehydrogenase cytochrome b556 subunit n=1 Tax=Sessilibacter corallicola TaxID=2904075 RepID=A0ABQ0A6H5_9GAMM|nr:succinate dehydrogenase, cytochrome b556 subunit [Sessilibacter corallicola]